MTESMGWSVLTALREHADPARTLAVCDRLTGDSHPMVVKALSWALRALVPVDPDAVTQEAFATSRVRTSCIGGSGL